jgi:hypothetical protein
MSGEGYTAVYHCATDVTKKSLTDWFSYNDTHPVAAAIAARITVLLKTWNTFRTHPVRHFEDIFSVGITLDCTTVSVPVVVTDQFLKNIRKPGLGRLTVRVNTRSPGGSTQGKGISGRGPLAKLSTLQKLISCTMPEPSMR